VEEEVGNDEISMSTGKLAVKRRKATLKCRKSNCSGCGLGSDFGFRHTECVTAMTFMPTKTDQNMPMIIASEYSLKCSNTGAVTSISYLAINPVLPSSSQVFQVVEEGDLQELREMLQNGEASLRDTDEGGRSLLFVRA
jgi:hypothetical protein